MRKEDRIRQQAQHSPEQEPEKPQARPTEQIKGQQRKDQGEQQPRRPGVMPIPD